MAESNKTIRVIMEEGSGEIVEKKSRFIATVKITRTEEEMTAFIDSVKKKYWDARHNCSAGIIGEHGEITRSSDDGEPSGTAGRPMLEVLQGMGLCNVTVVVTRYFGGVLLGTGGLIRAYTQAVQEGLRNCTLGLLRQGVRISVEVDYNNVGKILYLLGNENIIPENAEYGVGATITFVSPLEKKDMFLKAFTEATSGGCLTEVSDPLFYVEKET